MPARFASFFARLSFEVDRVGPLCAQLHFNLMAITADRLSVLTSRLASIETRLPSATGAHRSALEDERAQVGEKLATEREKRERWDFDNKVRRHVRRLSVGFRASS